MVKIQTQIYSFIEPTSSDLEKNILHLNSLDFSKNDSLDVPIDKKKSFLEKMESRLESKIKLKIKSLISELKSELKSAKDEIRKSMCIAQNEPKTSTALEDGPGHVVNMNFYDRCISVCSVCWNFLENLWQCLAKMFRQIQITLLNVNKD